MYTAALIGAMGERGPFVMVGTMDGGAARIYSFALAHPAAVHALVPLEYGEGEFVTARAYHGWDEAAAADYAAATVRSRLGMCDLIRFLPVQWGIMPLFAPSSPTFVPAGDQGECHFLNLFQEGQWDMQCRYLAAQAADPVAQLLAPDVWAANRSLAPHIPVLSISNVPADPCGGGGGGPPPGSAACDEARFGAARGVAFARNMTTMTRGSVYMNCAGGDAVCGDWLGGGSTVPFVTQAVLAWLGNLSVGA